ncbi:MAG: TIGR03915 family putative DNA repair protein [Ferruginibacter sp.]
MNIVSYDGSFEGLLTAVFEIYEYKISDPQIVNKSQAAASLFGETHHVQTDPDKSKRVYKKLKDKLTPNAFSQLYKTFLSELTQIENVIYRYIVYVLAAKTAVENNYAHPDVLLLQQVSRKVHREKHRMEAFVRFQLTKDDLYYSLVQPDFNVLPLISKHFQDRYTDQRWLIYDSLRKYGLYYDLHIVEEVSLNFSADVNDKNALKEICDDKEELYQKLWQQYFSSVNIAARKNIKLHIQHMPKRYWKHLVEKNVTEY